MNWLSAGFVVGMTLVGLLGWETARQHAANEEIQVTQLLPEKSEDFGYVSSDACRACHPSQYASWHQSYHRTMTQIATPDTVLGRFDGVPFAIDGRHYRVSRRGDEFWMEVPDPSWQGPKNKAPSVELRTRLVSGSHTLQAYWFSGTVDRHLYLAPLTWIIEDQKWVERKDALVFDPERPPKEVSTWNGDCIQCHATGGQPRFLVDPTTQAVKVDTRVGELGIACEACHGPGHEHVLANQDPIRRYGLHFGDGQDPTIVEPRRLTQQKAMQICSVCHAVQLIADSRAFLSTGIQFRPGQETNPSQILIRALEAPSKPELAAFLSVPGAIEMRFWPDGPSRPVGREVSSLIESKCYQGGLTCLNCHSMHNGSRSKQVAPEMDTDKACASCHPDLVKDAAAHSHHRAGSSGAACSSCHMPPTTFGQMRGNRNHFIESPNPAKTLATGRPNACNVCHLDRTMAWTVEQMNAWYGTPKIELDEDERQVSATVLQLLKGDALQRAIASASLGWAPAQEASGTDWIAPYLGVLMRDSYAVVRYRAYASLRTLPGYQGFEFDYVGPVAEREQGSARVLQQWKRSAANPALLIGPDGLEQELIDRLLARRDNRSIILLE